MRGVERMELLLNEFSFKFVRKKRSGDQFHDRCEYTKCEHEHTERYCTLKNAKNGNFYVVCFLQ